LPAKAPNQDLQFIKDLKSFETVDKDISKVSIKKICHHLWYSTEETAALSFFDDSIPALETKLRKLMLIIYNPWGGIDPLYFRLVNTPLAQYNILIYYTYLSPKYLYFWRI